MQKAIGVFTERTKSIVKTARNVMEDHLKAALNNQSGKNAGRRFGEFGKIVNGFVMRFASAVKSDLRAENAYRSPLLCLLKRVDTN